MKLSTREMRRSLALGWLLLPLASLMLVCPVGMRAQAKSAADDAACLTCHGQPGMKSDSGRSIFVDPAKHKAGVHSVLPCVACHTDIKDFPHPAKIQRVECSSCHAQEASDLAGGIHSALGSGNDGCMACHGSAHDTRPAAAVAPRQCGACHSDQVRDFLSSVHGKAAARGDSEAPTCSACHGPIHKALASSDPMSPVAKKNFPATCGSCHSNPEFLAKHQIPFSHPVEAYEMSVHGQAVAAGNEKAPACSDCHGSHAIFGAQDARAQINRWKVPQTCGACHAAEYAVYKESVHGQAVAHGSTDAPVCTDCHGEHVILAPSNPESTVSATRLSSVTCGRCHSDERINARYNLPADRVPTFADSFHGLALRSGSQTVANCASCHGAHNIFPSSDARSTVNAANLAKTCGACHAGAGQNFAIGRVHIAAATAEESAVSRWIRRFYWLLIPLTIGFMLFHHLLDFVHKLLHRERHVETGEQVPRMNRNFRIAHWLTMISFPVLVITGFALKFPDSFWAQALLQWESRFAFRGTLHRGAAIVLLLSLAYHFGHLIFVRRDRVFLRAMIPQLKDMTDLRDMLLYNLGVLKTRPFFGTFNYVEKMEYLAFLWGTVVMATSGFLLWFNNLTLRFFPKWVTDAATSLHYYEAILATGSILIWHMYTVIFDPDVYPGDPAWLTGKTSADHLLRTRPAYYKQLMEELAPAAPPPPNTSATPVPAASSTGGDSDVSPKPPEKS